MTVLSVPEKFPESGGARQETEDLYAALKRSRENVRTLYDLFRKTARSADVDGILARAQTLLLDRMAMPAAAVYLMKPEGDGLSLQTWRNLPLEYLEKGRTLAIGEVWTGCAVPEHRVIRMDLPAMPDSPLETLARHPGYAMGVAIPVMAGQTTLGILCLFSEATRDLVEDEIQLLETAGGLLGILLQNARYMEALNEELRGWVETEKALTVAKREAEAASQAKSDFLANMSHEIRTPMNAITGLGHLLLQTEMSPKQHNYVRKIQSASRNLLGIINDILDFSKIESGNLTLEEAPFNLEDVLAHLSNLIGEEAVRKGIDLIFAVEADVPVNLNGDALRLIQVLTNLANNAVKFTETGEIVVGVETVHRECTAEGNAVTLRFTVRDTGIGLTRAQIDKLFRSFSQADSSITRRYGGTGLGLAISKQLIALMGGDIGVDSEVGQGSTFSFTARFQCHGDCDTDSYPIPGEIQGKKILVVDDNIDPRNILCAHLSAAGFSVEAVSTGEKALERLADQESAFDLVLMDAKVSGMNGFNAVERMRHHPGIPQSPAIIMMTAFNRDEVLENVERTAVDGLLVKPIGRSLLYESVVAAMSTHSRELEETSQTDNEEPPAVAPLQGHVLVAEDNYINQQVIRENLRKAGCQVTLAVNGEEAVAAIREKRYDVVLMDIQMPKMDGLEATRIIRSDPRHRSLPIIALTAHAVTGDREKCLAVGMNDYIPKPIEPEQLFSVVRKWAHPPVSESADDADPREGPVGRPANRCSFLLDASPSGEKRESVDPRSIHQDLSVLQSRIRENEYIDVAILDGLVEPWGRFAPDRRASLDRLWRSLSSFNYDEALAVVKDMMQVLTAALGETPEGKDHD